ncbi:MAG: hypothetical protein ACLRSW_10285 [Christensenellaceae bacterium]
MKPDYKNWVPRGLLFSSAAWRLSALPYACSAWRAWRRRALRIIGVLFSRVFLFAVDGHICKYVLRLYNGKRKISSG